MFKFNQIIFIGSLVSVSILSAREHEAKELIAEAKCMECHNKQDFKHRPDKVNSLKKLRKSVNACVYSTKTSWFDDETRDVTLFLNQQYYHYKVPPQED